MNTKKSHNSILKYYYFLFPLMTMLLASCQEDKVQEEFIEETHSIFIDIDIDEVLKNASPGDEVPDFVKMYNGLENYAARTNGQSDLVTEVVAGNSIIWQPTQDNFSIISFDFQVLEGENVFEISDGSYPELQTDDSWQARVSSDAGDAVIKYSIFFEIEGEGTFWWDPLIKT